MITKVADGFSYLQFQMLRAVWPMDPSTAQPHGEEKLTKFLQPMNPAYGSFKGLDVLDFGCGDGHESLSIAKTARSVVGLDINQKWIDIARRAALEHNITNAEFVTATERLFDVAISIDAFEHFADPGAMLELMHARLRPGGLLVASFGPTWYHPRGGHLFSAFPWAHVLCTEQALLKWRNQFRAEKATRLMEGLNGWSIGRFERMVRASAFRVEQFECVPIKVLRPIHCRLTREVTTSIVRMRLRKM
jgi:SAM-dependent methyltransferase